MDSNEQSERQDRSGRGRDRDRGTKFGRGGRGRRWKMLLIVPAMAGFILIKAGAVLLLWNALVPEVFHLAALTYVQALELTVLAKLLLGGGRAGFGRFGGGPFAGRLGGHGGGGHWKERWSKLSPDEREKYREELRKRFDGDHA